MRTVHKLLHPSTQRQGTIQNTSDTAVDFDTDTQTRRRGTDKDTDTRSQAPTQTLTKKKETITDIDTNTDTGRDTHTQAETQPQTKTPAQTRTRAHTDTDRHGNRHTQSQSQPMSIVSFSLCAIEFGVALEDQSLSVVRCACAAMILPKVFLSRTVSCREHLRCSTGAVDHNTPASLAHRNICETWL